LCVFLFNFEHKLEKPFKIKLTPKQAIIKLGNYCAYQERCQKEVIEKLAELGVYGNDAQEILAELITLNYVNEERFAKAFSSGKFRHKRWGKQKITRELNAREISAYCIKQALLEIPDDDYAETMQQLAAKKWNMLKQINPFEKRNNLAKYLIGKGFEPSLVWDYVKSFK